MKPTEPSTGTQFERVIGLRALLSTATRAEWLGAGVVIVVASVMFVTSGYARRSDAPAAGGAA